MAKTNLSLKIKSNHYWQWEYLNLAYFENCFGTAANSFPIWEVCLSSAHFLESLASLFDWYWEFCFGKDWPAFDFLRLLIFPSAFQSCWTLSQAIFECSLVSFSLLRGLYIFFIEGQLLYCPCLQFGIYLSILLNFYQMFAQLLPVFHFENFHFFVFCCLNLFLYSLVRLDFLKYFMSFTFCFQFKINDCLTI